MKNSKKLNVVGIVGGSIGILAFLYGITIGCSLLTAMSVSSEYVSVFKSIQTLLQNPSTKNIGLIEIVNVILTIALLVEAALVLTGGIMGKKEFTLTAKIMGIVLIPLFYISCIAEYAMWSKFLGQEGGITREFQTILLLPMFNLATSILSIITHKVQKSRDLLKNNPVSQPANHQENL